MEDSKVISILAVSYSQDAASSLLNQAIPGLTTSDNQEWTVQEGDFTVKAYIKYPGTDIHRRGANWLDLLLVSVPEGNQFEREVLDYSTNRKDVRSRFLVDSNTGRSVNYNNITVIDAGSFAGSLRDYAAELTKFNSENSSDNEIDYHVNRQIFNIGNSDSKLDKLFAVYKKAFKTLGKVAEMVKTFSSFDHSQGKSENNGTFNFSPENTESNGIGVLFDLYLGEIFDQENVELPLVVRDNYLTASIEFLAKSEEGADAIIQTFETLREMLTQMGDMLSILEKVGVTLSFSKNKNSVFIDLTFGGLLGEAAINIIRGFNFQSFKFSCNHEMRIQTNLNFKDLYENPDVDNIIEKLGTLTLKGHLKIINIRTLFRFILELSKHISSDDKKKQVNLISYFGLMLSVFESSNFNVSYDSSDVKSVGMQIADGVLGGEGASQQMIGMGNQQLTEGILPMVLGTIEGIKPMLEPFMAGLREMDLDKISVEFVSPAVRGEYKMTILLPGLTEFVNKNITN